MPFYYILLMIFEIFSRLFLDFASSKTPEPTHPIAEGENLVAIPQKHEVNYNVNVCLKKIIIKF